MINDDEEILEALPIRRKRDETQLTAQDFAKFLADALADSPDETDSYDQSGGSDSGANCPRALNRKPPKTNTKRASRKIVKNGTVEVKDFGVQVSESSAEEEIEIIYSCI